MIVFAPAATVIWTVSLGWRRGVSVAGVSHSDPDNDWQGTEEDKLRRSIHPKEAVGSRLRRQRIQKRAGVQSVAGRDRNDAEQISMHHWLKWIRPQRAHPPQFKYPVLNDFFTTPAAAPKYLP